MIWVREVHMEICVYILKCQEFQNPIVIRALHPTKSNLTYKNINTYSYIVIHFLEKDMWMFLLDLGMIFKP